jgi:glycosyltransferase involved in cell wall biosynthesis
MKIALVSHSLPPTGAGQALVIFRLFQHADPAKYCLISPESSGPDKARYAGTLPGRRYELPKPFRVKRGERFGLRYARETININLAVRQHARRIADIVRREQCEAIVACTGDVTLLPAGFSASRTAGVPFYAYIFDDYVHRECEDPSAALWARRFEPRFMKGATKVIVPNEMLRDDLRRRYNVEAVVIHNSFDISPYAVNGNGVAASGDKEIKIVYTGEIYDAHYDAFRNMVHALQSLSRPDVKLHIYTNRSAGDLETLGITGPVVHHPGLPATEMPNVQMDADILFLPLAFESPYPNLVRNSSTTKLGEYLAARRPVLVHAPKDSFVSWYFRTNDCGVLIDENDPARVADGINTILSDDALCRRMATNAWACARRDFTIEASRDAFARLVGWNGSEQR